MTTRRQVLAWAGGIVTASATTPQARAIEPFRRTGKPVLKLSMAAYSLRDFLAPKKGKPTLDLLGFLDFCASLGLEGAEPTSYYFPKEVDADYVNRLKRHAHLLGLDLSAGAISNDFCQAPGPKLDDELASCRRWIAIYASLGVRAIRVFAGKTPKGATIKEAIARCIARFEQLGEDAGTHGVFLALENHGGITAQPADMLQIVRGVQSPWFGVNLDTGNFRTADPYADLAKIAPYAVNVQIKVDIHPNGKDEPADLARLVRILRDVGYSGWVALEYEGKAPPYEAIPKAVETLRGLLR